MNEGEQRPSGSQRKGVSNQEEGREERGEGQQKRRGSKAAATRANTWWGDTKMTEEVRRRQRGAAGLSNKNNVKLSFEENVGIMDSRNKGYDEITRSQVKESEENKVEELVRTQQVAAEDKYRQAIDKVKVPIYGTLRVDKKPEHAGRFFSANVNGLSFWMRNNYKQERLAYIFDKYKIDTMGLQEVCINWMNFKPSQSMASMLRKGAEPIKSVVSQNKTEGQKVGNKQRGGTSTIIKDSLAAYVKKSGTDHTGLGRWSWYLLEGEPGHFTYVITAYAPCGNKDSGDSTYFKQIERYIQANELRTNPKTMFREDLLSLLRKWREGGRRVVLMMDANEHVEDGMMCRQLKADDLKMTEVVHQQVSGTAPKTFFRGSHAIDGIWVSSDLEILGASYLPFDSSVGDHRPVMLDISLDSLLGKRLNRVVPVKARRLNSKVGRIRQKYIDKLESLFKQHNIYRSLLALEKKASFPASTEVKDTLEQLDQLIVELMLLSERKCRKICAAHYEFSPVIKEWLDRCHAFRQLIRLKTGKRVGNPANVKRFAMRCKIENASSMSASDLYKGYAACKERTKLYMADSPWMRKKFLTDKLLEAIESDRVEEAKIVKDMLRNEAQKKTWGGIHRTMGKSGGGAVMEVQKPVEGEEDIHCDTRTTVEGAIQTEIEKRMDRAKSAPICQGTLFDLLGYDANTETAQEILEGTFIPPLGTHPPTVILLEEIARIWEKMGEGEVNIVISKEDYQYYWKRAKEKTSSSFSGVHFGHYKAAAHSDFLSATLAKKLSLITETGSSPERWARGLSVMLEKIAGVALVTKLRAILLMEADNNFHNKLIFGTRMLNLARENGMVPEEIYNEKGKTAEDAILQQVLTYDLARQWKRPLLVASVDASQCYDRIAHSMAALTLRAYKVRSSSVMGMLQPIHCMEFYLRTGYGESENYVGGKENTKQGACQGNGAAPATWQQISALMIQAQHRHRHGITIQSPISKRTIKQVGVLFVDDTNLWNGLEEDSDVLEVAHAAQDGVTTWGQSLIATGGVLNPEKCNYTIHDMTVDKNGRWEYTDAEPKRKKGQNDDEDELDAMPPFEEVQLGVPMVNGDITAINCLKSSEAVKNLGLFARPDGVNSPHLDQMKGRLETWTTKVKNGMLPTRSVWTSYTHQLWAGMRYGLGASSATMKELREGLGSSDFYLISSLGVVRSIKKEWRYLPPAFSGMGLFDLTIETTAATINSLLQHYGTDTPVGITLQATLENLQIELGVRGCPLDYDFDTWGHLATNCWVKSLWEKVDHFGLGLHLEYKSLQPPRERDYPVMEEIMKSKPSKELAIKINRCRKRQEVIWMSDLASASGRIIEPHYYKDWHDSHEGSLGKHRSSLPFGREYPTKTDWEDWGRALNSLTFQGPELLKSVGAWRHPALRIWRYWLDESGDTVTAVGDKETLVYSARSTQVRGHRKFDFSHAGATTATPRTGEEGTAASIIHGPNDDLSLVSSCVQHDTTDDEAQPDIIDLLDAWGGTWMWEKLEYEEDLGWLSEALTAGSLVCVTDGSYDRARARDISGAGWIIYCVRSRKSVRGAFAERSNSASSYRGELLGMLAIHLFLLAVEESGGLGGGSAEVHCDNKGAIYTFDKEGKRVPSGSKNADIQRVLRRIKARMKGRHSRHHVKAHQDDHKRRSQLSIAAQLNCICDDLAKDAVKEARVALDDEGFMKDSRTDRLPLELASLMIGTTKQTTDVAKDLRYLIGKSRAKPLMTKTGVMSAEAFDLVQWDDLRRTLDGKPRMYQLWYAKQGSGYCGTGKNMKQWQMTTNSRCPNCNKPKEDAAHLNVCNSKDRKRLLQRSICELEVWMEEHNTHPDILEFVPLYLAHRGDRRLASYDWMSAGFRAAADEQDQIGWRNFTEGKIAERFRLEQESHLLSQDTRMTIDSWMKGFIDQLLSLTHSQWIFRNITKHHSINGTIQLEKRESVMKEIERQLDMGMGSLPEESRCLLEIDTTNLYRGSSEDQQYWLFAIIAARQAAKAALSISKGETKSWTDVCRDKRYEAAQSQTPLPQNTGNEQRPSPQNEPQPEEGPPPNQAKSSGLEKSGASASNGRSRKRARKSCPVETPQAARGIQSGTQPARSTAHRSSGIQEEGGGLLSCYAAPPTTRASIDQALDTTRQFSAGTIAARKGNESVDLGSLQRLGATTWLNDQVINFIAKQIIQQGTPDVHCYSSYFFSTLLHDSSDAGRYDFSTVRNWHRSRELRQTGTTIFDLKHLLVPINEDNTHWLLIHVDIESRQIRLYDSSGDQTNATNTNSRYLTVMRRYLQDAETDAARGPPARTTTPVPWTTSNRSGSSPKQTNGYDCGVFTLVNMSLLASGTNLNSSSYSQETIYRRQTRQHIAHVILSTSEIPVPVQIIGGRLPQAATSPPSAPPVTPRQRKASVPQRAAKALRKRKRQRKHSLVVGGKRVTRMTTYTVDQPTTATTLLNRKRTELSLATESNPNEISQRQTPEQRTKRKGAEELPRRTKFQKR